jgi:predicted AlkP superfamily phosphohydrolase/phosphomutase
MGCVDVRRGDCTRQCWLSALLLLAIGCTPDPETGPSIRVSLIGVDGATWRVLEPMLERGELPHFARLIAEGVRGPLRSQKPLESPPVWTTIATGVSRERHGVVSMQIEGELVSSRHRRSPALWKIVSDAGLRSAVIGWWATYPAEHIEGVIVSERALKTRENDIRPLLATAAPDSEVEALVYPAESLGALSDLLFREVDHSPDSDEKERVATTMRLEDETVARALLRLRERERPFALEMILLRGVDPVSHFFWKFYEPSAPVYPAAERPTPEQVAAHGSTVEDHYRYVDSLLGDLALDPSPRHVVMLISDHGFEAGRQPFRSGATLSGTHMTNAARDGILIAAGGPFQRGRNMLGASILDVTPTVLHLLGLPVADNLEGRVWTVAFDPAWDSSHPVQKLAAYPGPPVALPKASPSGAPELGADALRDELRALGYIE